ncbi:MAG: hypothetical protein R3Y53_01895 [Bacillota bacterium]
MKNLGFLIAGVCIGAGITYYTTKKKFEQINEEEIASVKARFKEKTKPVMEEEVSEVVVEDATNEKEMYQEATHGYTSQSTLTIVTEAEVDDCDYEVLSLTYYTDDILCDDANTPVEDLQRDIESLVGGKLWTVNDAVLFDGVLYVRNHALSVDYEIANDQRRYADIL